jgi:predicted transposase YdaD
MKRIIRVMALAALFPGPAALATPDTRMAVELPPPMRAHMLANMRDHLAALHEIQAALARDEAGRAAGIAEQRIGMSSLESHGAGHMAPYMPKPMQDIGTAMHRAASRFARVAEEAGVRRDLRPALQALSDVTQQCVACHAGYRLK